MEIDDFLVETQVNFDPNDAWEYLTGAKQYVNGQSIMRTQYFDNNSYITYTDACTSKLYRRDGKDYLCITKGTISMRFKLSADIAANILHAKKLKVRCVDGEFVVKTYNE